MLIWDPQNCIDVWEVKGEKPRLYIWNGNTWVKKELLGGGELEKEKIN